MGCIPWTADLWDSYYPVGTPVDYFPTAGRPFSRRSRTRSEAWDMGHGDTMVKIEGQAGGVRVHHLVVVVGAGVFDDE